MRFKVAAGILVPTLPVFAEPAASKRLTDENYRDLDFSRSLDRVADQPKFRRGTLDLALASHNGGLLKNQPLAQFKICNPWSSGPDIGILSCDVGYECVVNQASILGGFCTLTSRKLQENDPCYLCGPGSEVGYESYEIFLNGNDGTTCEDLAVATYYNSTGIDTSTCLSVSQLAQDGDCCRDVSVATYGCNMCGDAMFYPESLVTRPDGSLIPCGYIQPNLNDTECELYSSYYAAYCCAPETWASEFPTPAPQPSTSEESLTPTLFSADGPTPTSHSATLLSTSTLVSIIGLTAATATSVLVLY
jgi:hypothetical protein